MTLQPAWCRVARAEAIYGVVLHGGAVDAAATARLRQDLAAAGAPKGSYDFGPGRSEWERVHGVAAESDRRWAARPARGLRRHVQAQVYRRLHETGPGPYHAPEHQSAFWRTLPPNWVRCGGKRSGRTSQAILTGYLQRSKSLVVANRLSGPCLA